MVSVAVNAQTEDNTDMMPLTDDATDVTLDKIANTSGFKLWDNLSNISTQANI